MTWYVRYDLLYTSHQTRYPVLMSQVSYFFTISAITRSLDIQTLFSLFIVVRSRQYFFDEPESRVSLYVDFLLQYVSDQVYHVEHTASDHLATIVQIDDIRISLSHAVVSTLLNVRILVLQTVNRAGDESDF